MSHPLKHLAIFAFYGLLAAIAVSQPLFHTTTHLPGAYHPSVDYYHFHWNYWWMRHAISEGMSIYSTDFVMVPFTHNLAYHTLTPFWFPLWALTEPLTGTIIAFNLIFLVALTLTGYLSFLFIYEEGANTAWALFGGAAMAFTPVILQAVLWSWVNILGWFWLPTHLFLWRRVVVSSGWRRLAWAVVQGIGLWAAGLTDLQYLLFLAFLLGPYALWTLWQRRSSQGGTVPRLLLTGLLAVITGFALLYIAGPLPHLLEPTDDYLAVTPSENAFALRWPEEYIFGSDQYDYNRAPISFLILPLALLAVVFGARRPASRRWFWLVVALPPLILSAGTQLPVLYALFHELMGGFFRFPLRFAPVFILPLMVFVGLTFSRSKHRLITRYAPLVLLVVLLADVRLFRPMPLQEPPTQYEFYAQMGAEPYDYVVLESPTAAGNGETFIGDSRALTFQYNGMMHGKRMLNGLLARTPPNHFLYLRSDHPFLSWLGQRQLLDPAVVRDQLTQMIPEWPIGYIVVHQDVIGLNTPTNSEIIGWFNSLPDLLCPVWVEGHAVVFRTHWHPDGCPARTPPQIEPAVYQIDIGTEGDEQFIGWGWHWQEAVAGITLRWMGHYPQTQLYLDVPPGAYELELTAQAFWEPRTLTVQVNGQTVGEAEIDTGGLQAVAFDVPADLIGDGEHVNITLDYDAVIVPNEVGQSGDTRRLSLAVDWVRLTAK
jgi:hypothetical protein